MSKKSIITVLIVLVISFTIISLYATFAYNEETVKLADSEADYNLIYSLKESSNKQLNIGPNEEKYIDITLTNTYEATVKYGMYYYLINQRQNHNDLEITLAPESDDLLEDTIKPNQTRIVSIKVKNKTTENIELIIGALIGFENGDINDLIKDNEILIK